MQGRGALRRKRLAGFRAPPSSRHDDLAVLDVADESRADDVERAGLGGEDRAAVEFAEHQRADAERIARADQLLVGQRDQRIGALDLAQRLDEALDEAAAARARDEVQDDFGVGGRLADRAVARRVARRSVRPLVRLPLWATAKPPASSSANSGCTLRRMVSPVVE